MPWKKASTMVLRQEFLALARQPDSNVRLLCRRYGISSKTGYKWLGRVRAAADPDALEAMTDRSRRPRMSPAKTVESIESLVCELRRKHPVWGGRKIHARLLALGHTQVPAPSTISDILRRHALIDPTESIRHKACHRFEHEAPNDLWQMDFLGHFATGRGRCHPLTIIDDHSRFCLAADACANETGKTVQISLTGLFRRYGLPKRILSDNGSPWGCDSEHRYTWLSAWLIRLGINISHGRPYHPQTQGKDERFNRTLKAEAIGTRKFDDVPHVQRHLQTWRDVYNLERPHEALGMKTPASRYVPSSHAFPDVLPTIEYGPGDAVRKVGDDGYLKFNGRQLKISQAFAGQLVALRPTMTDGKFDVFFCHVAVASIDLTADK